MTVFTVTYRKIISRRPYQVEDSFPAIFTTYDKAVDYVKRMLGKKAELVDDQFGFWEEWESYLYPDRQYIIEERTVDTD